MGLFLYGLSESKSTLNPLNRSIICLGIWPASRWHCRLATGQILKQYKKFYSLYRAFETLQEMLVRRLFAQCLETVSSMIPMLITYYRECVSEGEISTCILMAQRSSDVTPGLSTGLMFLMQQIIDTFSGPFSYLWPSKISANERRRYICNVFYHWLRPCSAIDLKWVQISLAWSCLKLGVYELTCEKNI